MAKWLRPFSLLAAKTYKRPEAKVGPHRSLRSSTKYLTRNPKYPRIHPRFYSPFWRNKPRHALSLQTRSVGAQKGVFAFFPSVRRKSMKKNVKSSIFRKKQVNFWVVYLLRRKPLIINKNMMMHRQIICLSITYQTSKSNISQISNFQLHFLIKLFLI